MRNEKDGVVLASIVAKETTNSEWSGLGSGLGFGTNGVGMVVGGMSGTKQEQTQRASDFEAPQKSEFNWWAVWGPMIALAIIGVLLFCSSWAMDFLNSGVDTNNLSSTAD